MSQSLTPEQLAAVKAFLEDAGLATRGTVTLAAGNEEMTVNL